MFLYIFECVCKKESFLLFAEILAIAVALLQPPFLPSDQLPFFIYKLFDILFSDILLATVGIRGGFWPDSWSATAQVLSTNQIHGLLQLNYCLLIRFMVSTTKYCLIRFMVCYCSNIVNQSDSWSATSQILSTNQIHSLLLLKYCLPIRCMI